MGGLSALTPRHGMGHPTAAGSQGQPCTHQWPQSGPTCVGSGCWGVGKGTYGGSGGFTAWGHSGGAAVPRAGLGTEWGWWTLPALSVVAVWGTPRGAGQGSDTMAVLCGPAQAATGGS